MGVASKFFPLKISCYMTLKCSLATHFLGGGADVKVGHADLGVVDTNLDAQKLKQLS